MGVYIDMEVNNTEIPHVLIVRPDVFSDERGQFLEIYNQNYHELEGMKKGFVQDNISFSTGGVLRGLHLQHPMGQGKLVSVLEGAVLDVAVDVRIGSPSFGRHVAIQLDSISRRQLWIPRGFAHGFLVLSERACVLYKCDASYSRACEMSVRWNDPSLGISWPVADPILSQKDASAPLLRDLAHRLPHYDEAATLCEFS
jgi:dTDP-4-dehydrorhamnose 3,5-epimerase